jgi:hypothetical protein
MLVELLWRVSFFVRLTIQKGQLVTVDTVGGRLHARRLPLITLASVLPNIETALEQMTIGMRALHHRLGIQMPAFMINVSSPDDSPRSGGGRPAIGLTRTEQFIAPHSAPETWSSFREFLLGRGVTLRRYVSSLAGKECCQLLPLVVRTREEYDALC